MKRKELSKVRREVGAKGLAARWAGHDAKATACLRVYPKDAEAIKACAKASRRLPADVVAALVKQAEFQPSERPQGLWHDFIVIDDPQYAVKI